MLYFRRILQLEKDNKRARYYVARRYASQQALPQARKMMESLAPAKVVDYMPAHIWMAMDLIAQARSGVKVDQAKLEHHLKTVCESDDPPSLLLFAYASLIEKKEKERAAVEQKEDDKWKYKVSDLMKKAARDRNFLLQASDVERELGFTSSADQMSESALLYYRRKAQEDPKDITSRLSAAKAFFQKKEYENAKKFLLEGILANDTLEYRKAYSDICITQFKEAEGQDKFAPAYLEDAIAKAPWNPEIGVRIAALMERDVVLSDSFKSALLKQVTERTASPITYLMLGSIAVKKNNMAEGIKYLELAYKLAPNAPLVINNYAMAMTMTNTPDWKRANELIDTALKIDPRNPELHDSKARILVGLGDMANAVTSFDIALQINPDRTDSRMEIIKALEKTGMQELANAHRTKLKEVLKKLQENADKKD